MKNVQQLQKKLKQNKENVQLLPCGNAYRK